MQSTQQTREANVDVPCEELTLSSKSANTVASATYISPPRKPTVTAANSRPQRGSTSQPRDSPSDTAPAAHQPEVTYAYEDTCGAYVTAPAVVYPTYYSYEGAVYHHDYYAEQMAAAAAGHGYGYHDGTQAVPMGYPSSLAPAQAPPMPILTLAARSNRGRGRGQGPVEAAEVVAAAPAVAPESPGSFYEYYCREIYGNVVAMACTAAGKTALQSILRTATAAMQQSGSAGSSGAVEMTAVEAVSLVGFMVGEVYEQLGAIALHEHGCHVLRALIYASNPEQTMMLVSGLSKTILLNMATDTQYTRRSIQALFERNAVDLPEVIGVLANAAPYLAATEQGCITLIRVYELCDEARRARLFEKLLPSLHAIAFDAFGNYVVQCVIEKSSLAVAAQYVVSYLAGHLLAMSCNKFASNVVEKVVRTCFEVAAVRRLLLDELVYNPAALQALVADPFGNFVVQRIIEATAVPADLKRISDRLRPALPSSRYATKIEAKLKQRVQQQRAQGQQPSQLSKPVQSRRTGGRADLSSTTFSAPSPQPQRIPSSAPSLSPPSSSLPAASVGGAETVAGAMGAPSRTPSFTVSHTPSPQNTALTGCADQADGSHTVSVLSYRNPRARTGPAVNGTSATGSLTSSPASALSLPAPGAPWPHPGRMWQPPKRSFVIPPPLRRTPVAQL